MRIRYILDKGNDLSYNVSIPLVRRTSRDPKEEGVEEERDLTNAPLQNPFARQSVRDLSAISPKRGMNQARLSRWIIARTE